MPISRVHIPGRKTVFDYIHLDQVFFLESALLKFKNRNKYFQEISSEAVRLVAFLKSGLCPNVSYYYCAKNVIVVMIDGLRYNSLQYFRLSRTFVQSEIDVTIKEVTKSDIFNFIKII